MKNKRGLESGGLPARVAGYLRSVRAAGLDPAAFGMPVPEDAPEDFGEELLNAIDPDHWFAFDGTRWRIENGVGRLTITGVMDAWWSSFRPAQLVAQIEEADISAIRINVASPGGVLSDVKPVYEAIRARHREDGVTVEAEGRSLVASAAVLMLLAADPVNRRVTAGTTMLIHPPWTWFLCGGGADDIRERAEEVAVMLEAELEVLGALYDQRIPDADKATIMEWLSNESVFTSSEAVEFGLVPEIVDDSPADDDSSSPAGDGPDSPSPGPSNHPENSAHIRIAAADHLRFLRR